MHAENIIHAVIRNQVLVGEVDAMQVASMLEPLPLACVLHQNPPHCFCRGREEMPSAVPVLSLVHIHEPNVRLVDQSRGLENPARLLLGHLLGRQLPQLVVHQRQELLGGRRIAVVDLRQDAGDLGHGSTRSRGIARPRLYHVVRSAPPSAPPEVVIGRVATRIMRSLNALVPHKLRTQSPRNDPA